MVEGCGYPRAFLVRLTESGALKTQTTNDSTVEAFLSFLSDCFLSDTDICPFAVIHSFTLSFTPTTFIQAVLYLARSSGFWLRLPPKISLLPQHEADFMAVLVLLIISHDSHQQMEFTQSLWLCVRRCVSL